MLRSWRVEYEGACCCRFHPEELWSRMIEWASSSAFRWSIHASKRPLLQAIVNKNEVEEVSCILLNYPLSRCRKGKFVRPPMQTENFDREIHFFIGRNINLLKESGRVILIKVVHTKILPDSFQRNWLSKKRKLILRQSFPTILYENTINLLRNVKAMFGSN